MTITVLTLDCCCCPPGWCSPEWTWPTTEVTAEPPWLRRCWLAAGCVALSVMYLEPIQANFAFGQITVVLMTLVIGGLHPTPDTAAARRAGGHCDRAEADARGVPSSTS